MKRFAKIILCLTVVFCLVFAAQTVTFAAAQKNELKTVSYISIDENGVKVDGILRSEQDLMELGISFNATQKTVTVMRDISCTAPVGIYCDLEGLLIKTSGKHMKISAGPLSGLTPTDAAAGNIMSPARMAIKVSSKAI